MPGPNTFTYFTPKNETQYITSDSTLRAVIEKFDFHKFTVVPVIDLDGKFLFTLSEGDVLRFIKNFANFNYSIAENVLVTEIPIYRAYKHLNISAEFEDVCKLSLSQNFIPLVDDRGMFIGIIRRSKVLDYLINK